MSVLTTQSLFLQGVSIIILFCDNRFSTNVGFWYSYKNVIFHQMCTIFSEVYKLFWRYKYQCDIGYDTAQLTDIKGKDEHMKGIKGTSEISENAIF